jgi:peptidoglycan/LPS O-acetylase OafA/YrhL
MATTSVGTPNSPPIADTPVKTAVLGPVHPRIPELDGLRGFAIFLVILCHYISDVPHGHSRSLGSMVGTVLGLGSSGVDLFFILSGFLIGGILLDSTKSEHYYQTFYLRRFHRIVPLYYAWVILFAAISVWVARFTSLTPYWIYLAFLQNYFYRQAPMQVIWFGATWSLGVEEQFYLLAPPIVRRVNPRLLTKFLLGIVCAAFVLRMFLVMKFGDTDHEYWGLRAAYFAMPSRADDLALGMLAAIAWRTPRAMQWIGSNLRFFKGMLIFCIASILVTISWMVRPNFVFTNTVGLPLFGMLFLSLLTIALTDRAGTIARILRLRALRELGRVSYCVYIIHVTVNWIVHRFVGHDLPRFDSLRSIAITLLAFGVTLLIAELSWRFFEHPLVRRGHQYKY